MSNDWQAGDLAMCVRGGMLPDNIAMPTDFPVSGRIYHVTGASIHLDSSGQMSKFLQFSDAPANRDGTREWGASRFIKVTPPEADEFDREVIDLMNQRELVV